MSETVLVTGGTGFVAGWCIVELLKRGYSVRTTVRSLSREPALRETVAYASAPGNRLDVCVADLTQNAGWDEAVAGCDYVLHVASPLGDGATRDPQALIGPARDGTLRVLAAAVKAGVKRIVMTSAAAAARVPMHANRISDETVWADPTEPRFDAYRRSKILAERAAWEFMERTSGPTTLTTILPGAVFGPVLSKENLGSVRIIQQLLEGRPLALPRLGFWVVDVRDLADLHIRAMTAPAAAGERFIAAGTFMWMSDIAETLRSHLGPDGARAPRLTMPDFIARIVALFIPQLRGLVAELGRRNDLTSDKAGRLLSFAPRPATSTLVACAASLPGIRGPGGLKNQDVPTKALGQRQQVDRS